MHYKIRSDLIIGIKMKIYLQAMDKTRQSGDGMHMHFYHK